MAYKRQNFQDGDILTYEHLNRMEDGIIENEKVASKAVSFDYQELSEQQKAQVIVNIGALSQKDIGKIVELVIERLNSNKHNNEV